MNEKEFEQILKRGESESIEFKKSTAQMEKALKAICGFLNHKGGKVYFGISDKPELIGQDVSDSTLKSISQKIRQKVKPEVSPEIKVLDVDGKKVIEVKIKKGSNKPYYLDGIAYNRVGTESPPIPPEELERLILKKNKIQWDSQICEEADLNDIDEEKVRWFLREARGQRGLNIPKNVSRKEALMRLKLLKNEKPTNAAVLLFGKEPANFFLQSEVKCIRFSGNEAVKPYIDFQTLEGNAFDLMDKAEDFVLRNIRKSIWLVPGQVQREEKYEYPPDAIREAIVNAVAHRDYESPSKVQVRVFDDYIEIWDPGRLPDGWTIEKLKKKHESIPKNPLLFRQLFWAGYVEDVGGGITDMLRDCKGWGAPEPHFEDTGTSFIITFRKPVLTDELLAGLDLNERQIKAIEYIKQNNRITSSEYQRLFEVSRKTANQDFEVLIRLSLIERKGKGKITYYVLSNACVVSSDRVTKGNERVTNERAQDD